MLPVSGKEAPNLVGPLDRAILSYSQESTRLGALYLKMETKPTSETSSLLRNLDDGGSPVRGDCVSESYSIIRAL